MTDRSLQDRLRSLPSVDRLIERAGTDRPRALAVAAARRAVDEARSRIRAGGEAPSFEEIVALTLSYLDEHDRSRLQPVINATGVLIHTNLGRIPLGDEQLDAVRRVAGAYSNLEYDITLGGRGSRYAHTGRLLAQVTGAEAGLVVNNNAAAVLLTLAGLCGGREVVISRGELVEIGGEFRIPEVMDIAGVNLVEVGTTNRTHLSDYEDAIGPLTAGLLKVHPSNYRVVGFTSSVPAEDLARLARGRGLLFLHDLGSGRIVTSNDPGWLRDEPTVSDALSGGADVVTFSGDKLLGGPQAGIIVGREQAIASLTKHALLRALRVDKMTLAALEKTLSLYLEDAVQALPLWAMASVALEELERRARRVVERINQGTGGAARPVTTKSLAGGGSLPGKELESRGLAVTHPSRSAAEVERTLRGGHPPVIARVEKDRVVLDLRTVKEDEDDQLADLVLSALRP